MEQYHQLTLNEWVDLKAKIQARLMGIKRNICEVGYFLRKAEETEGYKTEGYKSLSEWAEREYGLQASTVSRFIAINKVYSIGGYSEEMKPEYEDFKRSQLEEMLKLPDKDREMIRPETARADIRDLKAFNKAEPAVGVADEIHAFVKAFWEDNLESLEDFYKALPDVGRIKEICNPSGNRSYRKGIFFLMFYDDVVKVKKFGKDPEDYSWQQFVELTKEAVGEEMPTIYKKPEVIEIAPAKLSVNTENEEEIEDGEEETKDAASVGDSGRNRTGSDRTEHAADGSREREEDAGREAGDSGRNLEREAGTAEEPVRREREIPESDAEERIVEELPPAAEPMNQPEPVEVVVESDQLTEKKKKFRERLNHLADEVSWEDWTRAENLMETVKRDLEDIRNLSLSE